MKNEYKVEIRNKKRRFYFNFSDIKKAFTWQDEFVFISQEGTIRSFGLLEVKNVWENGNKIYEKHWHPRFFMILFNQIINKPSRKEGRKHEEND